MCFNWFNSNGPGIQAIATALLVVITGFYAWRTSQMAMAMKKASENQRRQIKIKGDIFTALLQWQGQKSIRDIVRETGHTEDEIKTVLPDYFSPNGPIVFIGFHDNLPYFRVSSQWDPLGPEQRQKVRKDVVNYLLRSGPKVLEEIITATGHSEDTIRYYLPDLLDPCGPVVCSGTVGGYHYRVKTEAAPGG